MARQIGVLFRLDVKVAGKLHRSGESRRHTAPHAADEHFYWELLLPEEPKEEISSERRIVSEELQAQLSASEELRRSCRHG